MTVAMQCGGQASPRLVLKNTFLEFAPTEVDSDGPVTPKLRRHRSVPKNLKTAQVRNGANSDAPCFLASGRAEEHLDRLNRAFNGTKKAPPTDEELRELQRMLREATSATPEKAALRAVQSNSSVSTMATDLASDCEDAPGAQGSSLMRSVWSSGSVSSMASAYLPECPEEEVVADIWVDFPKQRSVSDSAVMPQGTDTGPAKTTLMIRNIPSRYTQRELVKELESLGFVSAFDFLYMPMDRSTMSNVGYAFVNFTSEYWAGICLQVIANYNFKRHQRTPGKAAAVSVAHIQGLEANLRHYDRMTMNSARLKKRRPIVSSNLGWSAMTSGTSSTCSIAPRQQMS